MGLACCHPTKVNKTAKSKTASRIARTTWAFREVDEGERLSLFVLTELNFFEFQVNFSLWIPNSVDQEKAYVSDNEYEGGESDDDLHQTAGAQSALGFTAAMAAAEKRAKATKFMHERRALEEPILTERASERQSRRYQAPPNEWLLDGIRTGAKTASDTLWKHLSEGEINQITKDRSKAREATEQRLYELPGASREVELKHMQKVMKETRKAILTQLFKCPIMNLSEVSFDSGSAPMLRLHFSAQHTEEVAIRFLDDTARESWRRNLQFVLQKSSSDGLQWGRGYDAVEPAAASPRTGRAARFLNDGT